MNKMAIIGGTGVYDPSLLAAVREEIVSTPYGDAVCMVGKYHGREFVFMTRHGKNHCIPPHRINYRANIYALKMLEVNAILATTAVGSMHTEMRPGEMVLTDQLLDFTKKREHTFFDGAPRPVAHVDFTEPYCPIFRQTILRAAASIGLFLHERGTYVCTEGPRFESAGEIKMYKILGGDVVGMTNVPECPLAREAEMSYCTVSMVTNYAAGISAMPLTHAEVTEAMAKNSMQLQKLLATVMDLYDPDFDAPSHHAMAEYGGFSL